MYKSVLILFPVKSSYLTTVKGEYNHVDQQINIFVKSSTVFRNIPVISMVMQAISYKEKSKKYANSCTKLCKKICEIEGSEYPMT